MPDILIRADSLVFADDLRTSLAAVWPEARFHLDAAQAHDVVLMIGTLSDEHTVPTMWLSRDEINDAPTNGMLLPIAAPVRLLDLVHRLKDLAARPMVYRWQNYRLDMASRLWHTPDGASITLTEKEVALLAYLGTQDKTHVTRDDLLRDVWNYAAGADTHTVETHLYRLRQKIETDPDRPAIVVNNGDGYVLGLLKNSAQQS